MTELSADAFKEQSRRKQDGDLLLPVYGRVSCERNVEDLNSEISQKEPHIFPWFSAGLQRYNKP